MSDLTQLCIIAVMAFSAAGLVLCGIAIGIGIGHKWFKE